MDHSFHLWLIETALQYNNPEAEFKTLVINSESYNDGEIRTRGIGAIEIKLSDITIKGEKASYWVEEIARAYRITAGGARNFLMTVGPPVEKQPAEKSGDHNDDKHGDVAEVDFSKALGPGIDRYFSEGIIEVFSSKGKMLRLIIGELECEALISELTVETKMEIEEKI